MTVDRTKITFAEAENSSKRPIRQAWGDLPIELRNSIYNSIDMLKEDLVIPIYGGDNFRKSRYVYHYCIITSLYNAAKEEFIENQHNLSIKFQENNFGNRDKAVFHIFGFILDVKLDYISVLDRLQYILRECNIDTLNSAIETAVRKSWSNVRLILKPPTFIPAVEPEATDLLVKNLEIIDNSLLSSAGQHMRSAVNFISNNQNRDAIRESIHAVESAVRHFTDSQSSTLGAALSKLSANGEHPALIDAFRKLYGYTSDTPGIRHSMVFGDDTTVEFEEAFFFVSACSAFVSYLIAKERRTSV